MVMSLPLPFAPSRPWPLLTDCCYIPTCMCIDIRIPKYILLGLYNVTRMYIFKADHLVVDSQLVCSPWRRLSLPLSAFLTALPVKTFSKV